MEIILMSDVEKVGKQGDILKVSDGFARNFLIPNKKAKMLTKDTLAQQDALRKKRKLAMEKLKKDQEALAAKIEKITCTFEMEVGEEDKLFGSVTSQDIAAALAKEGIEIDKRKIVLEDHIKKTGEYTASVKLHAEVEATIKLNVVAKV